MRVIQFTSEAFTQFTEWQVTDKKIFEKIVALIKETERNPFEGSGKPEPLKHELQGY